MSEASSLTRNVHATQALLSIPNSKIYACGKINLSPAVSIASDPFHTLVSMVGDRVIFFKGRGSILGFEVFDLWYESQYFVKKEPEKFGLIHYWNLLSLTWVGCRVVCIKSSNDMFNGALLVSLHKSRL